MNRLLVIITIFFINFYIYPQNNKFSLKGEELQALYDKVENEFKTRYNNGNIPIHTSGPDFAAFLLNAVFVKFPEDRIDKALNALKKFQNKNIATDRYLNFYWYWGDKEVRDPNAVEFINRQLNLLWILYKDNLSETSKKTITEILKLSSIGIKNHSVKLSYTNIILMKIWNLISYGESFNDKSSREEGYKIFNEWIKYISLYGISEYLSPTYYAVDLENLSLIYNFTQNSEIKKKVKIILDYFWLDITANWYAPSARLGGTHSRDYDRLYGHGQLDNFLIKAGFEKEIKPEKYTTPYEHYSFYRPSSELKKIIDTKPRYIIERWGENSFNFAFNYIGDNFSIASAMANYHNMDKTPLLINLGSGVDTPQINFFMDERSDYYGFKKIEERSGHMKSLHMIPFLTSVQNKNEVLFISSAQGSGKDYTKLESIITLPADAQFYLDDKKLEIDNYRTKWIMYPQQNFSSTFIDVIKENNINLLRIKDNNNKTGIGIYREFTAQPQSNYKTSINFKGGSIYLYINWYDIRGNRIGDEKIRKVKPENNDFTEFSQTEKAPEKAYTVRVWIYSTTQNLTEVFIKNLTFANADKNEILADFDFKERIDNKILIPSGKNLIIRREDAVAVIRAVYCADINDNPLDFFLYNDGIDSNALRLTAAHSEVKTLKKGTTAFWAYAADKIESEDTLFDFIKKIKNVRSSGSYKDNILTVTCAGINAELKLSADIDKKKQIYSSLDKNEYIKILLSINNNDIGKEILEKLNEKN